MAKKPAGAPATPRDDEGESQTVFFHPHEGGSYVRQADGSLKRVVDPTAPPETAPKE